jgi:hypothetical protein
MISGPTCHSSRVSSCSFCWTVRNRDGG